MNKISISIIGCGWLGLPLAERLLLEKKYHTRGTTTSVEKCKALSAKGIESYVLQLPNFLLPSPHSLWESEIFFINIPPSKGFENVEEDYPAAIEGLLQAICAQSRPQKPWIIFASTTGVYGAQSVSWLNEDLLCKPERAGAKAVFSAEQCLVQYKDKLDYTILRFAGLVGGQRQPGRFLAGKQHLETGLQPVNLVHLDDCIELILALLEKPILNELFNVCSDEHPFQQDFYPQAALQLGLEPPSFLPNVENKSEGSKVSNKKIKKALAYVFKWPDPSLFPNNR